MEALQGVNTGEIEQITAEIIAYEGTMVQSAWEIGQRLIKAKDLLEHGAWSAWLTQRVNFSERKAQSYMRLAREYPNPLPVAGLGIRKALALLDVPAEERETFAQEHDAERISVRELEQAIRERNTAVEEREAAEQSRLEMERSLQTANGALDARTAELAEARKELEELRNKPTEVAVETVVDEDAIKKASKEAAKEAKAKAEAKAAKELEARAAQIAKLEQELKNAKASRDTERAEQAEAQVAQLRRELEIARNEDVLGAQLAFNQICEAANRMQGHILRLDTRGQTDEAAKCRKAVRALVEKLAQLAKGV